MNEHLEVWFDTYPALEMVTNPSILYFAVALLLVLLAKPIKGLTTRYNLNDELTKNDNKAVALATAGFILGVLTIIRGAMISDGEQHENLFHSFIDIAVWTGISLVLLLASAWINRKFLLNRFDLHKELITDRNIGSGAVLAGTYIGTASVISASISGTTGGGIGMEILDTLVYFIIGQLGFILVGKIYQSACGYDVHEEIEKDNAGAGIALGSTLLAMGLLIGGQIRRCDSLVALAVWIPLSLAILMASRWLLDCIVLPNATLKEEITKDSNWGVALLEGAAVIGIALLLDASFQ